MSQQTIVVQNEGQTGLGTAGLIFSTLGWITCGVLCPIGAALSFFGLFGRGQKGHAIAGLIVGFPGVIFLVFMGFGIIASVLGIGAAAATMPAAIEAAERQRAEQEARLAADEAAAAAAMVDVELPALTEEPAEDFQLEPGVDLLEMLPDEPPAEASVVVPVEAAELEPVQPVELEPVYRTFSDASGRFTVEAAVVARTANAVKLERKDTGKQVTIPIDKLSEADQKWLRENR